ncbi:helix-turn-helix domain-containing protein [Cecembia calidifontis]|jgi:YesN/AraC family two-component response regulator|uniref:AraC family transcriptional regulator n=1 Tax=Cecembia calidifontis TaxID=1187080 RepID=A0A4Q7PDB0_9BACT|nr:AraC family transcriptional regulator [Cecembia calidifontis]RZS98354.1 AraC family transcriptional regulator [Cecembia calidifontis]
MEEKVVKEIQVKNMVCPRCILAVEQALQQLSIPFEKVVLGKVLLSDPIEESKFIQLEQEFHQLGFEILKSREVQKIEEVKRLLQGLIQNADISEKFNLSDFIREHIPEDYSRISHLFSSTEGITIERFFIELKLDKVKEWLFYEEIQLSEMAWKLGYSSVQHLSSQFKKHTGMTPSAYKKIRKGSFEGWK